MTSAQNGSKELIREIQSQTPKTLAVWRLSHPPLVQALEDFAAKDDDNSSLLEQVQSIFGHLNPLLAQQEQDQDYFSKEERRSSSTKDEFSVVFGGKYSATTPQSISEMLVSKLAKDNVRVYTASRSKLSYELPNNLTHIVKQNLDSETEVGMNEFLDVMTMAKQEWQQESYPSSSTTLVLYLTLGQHKGENPFVRNLRAAENFSRALLQTTTASFLDGRPWRVVLTGTDATLPSTHPDTQLYLGESGEFTIPTYKILKYNYVYAMSKLGQYYIVAQAVAQLCNRPDIVEQTAAVISKIQEHVHMAGEDGTYREETAILPMKELDDISRQVISIEAELQDHFWIAKGISICYTPLHAKPWTEQAKSAASPKSYILEQIVRRLKNAVSIEQAAYCHFPPHDEYR